MRLPLAAAVAGAIALAAAALAAPAAPPVLKMPGRADQPVAPESLLGADERDVRMEDVEGNVTIYHGQPLLAVLEKAGLDVRTMAGERKSAAAVAIVKARDGYTVAFSIGELRNNRSNPKVFLVSETTIDPLPENEGPVRLIVYGDSVRSSYALATIELKYLAENKK
jgi:hypothetical protein